MQHSHWQGIEFVAFDLETTGRYPVGFEICEIGGVRWRRGRIVDKFSSLVRHYDPMDPVAQSIHGISAQELAQAPEPQQVLKQWSKFTRGATLVAHHAPFDMGFLCFAMQKHGYTLPEQPVLCTSLITRQWVRAKKHTLSHLATHFGIEHARLHRAYEDARVCMQVLEKTLTTLGPEIHLQNIQKQKLLWKDFGWERFLSINPEHFPQLRLALEQKQSCSIQYMGGSKPGEWRTIRPIGLVMRPPDDDFVVAEVPGTQNKRYLLNKISAIN